MRMLITGGLVARADGVFNTDILIEGDRILELGERLHEAQQPEGTEIVDVSGCVVMPGGVDAHTHVNLTVGDAHVSDGFEAGTLAAAWGGTTTIVEHPGFGPQGCDLPHQPTAYLEQADGRCHTDYALHGVFQHVDDAVLARIPRSWRRDFPRSRPTPPMTAGWMTKGCCRFSPRSGMRAACSPSIAKPRHHPFWDKLRREAPRDPMSHPRSRPARCEAEAVNRILKLAKTAEAPVYIVHLSTAEGLACVREAQKAGQPVIAETCPQYLLLDESAYAERDGLKYIMAPPLRTEADRAALWEGLADGSISVAATDHCSFSLAQKREHGKESVLDCPGGVPGVETRIPLLFSEGVLHGRLTLPRFVDVVSTSPARLMGLASKGRLEPGADADIVVIDPTDERLIKTRNLHQKADCTRMRAWSCAAGPAMSGCAANLSFSAGSPPVCRTGKVRSEDALGPFQNEMAPPHTGAGDARKALLPQCPFLSSFHILPRRRIDAYRSLHTAGRRNAAPLDAARPAEQTTVRHRP
ncbi:MAG: amidohydrolase family protein [Bilophila wadsworthia]